MTARFSKMVAKLPRFKALHKVDVDVTPTSQAEMEQYVRIYSRVDGNEVLLPPADWGFTFDDVMAKDAEIKADAMADLRTKRNELLQEADSVTMSCYSRNIPVPADWATYQQTLRDLPENSSPDYDDAGQLTGVTFPMAPATKP